MKDDYRIFLQQIKTVIAQSQQKAIVSVNNQLIFLYWIIGNLILTEQAKHGWGSNVINKLSTDIGKSFPALKGFSLRNLGYMKKFAQLHSFESFGITNDIILQAVLAKLESAKTTKQKKSVAANKTSKKNTKKYSNDKAFTPILQAPLAKLEEQFKAGSFTLISWYHHITLIDKIKNPDERHWYMMQSIENGWSRNIMVHMIESNLYKRQKTKKKISNFKQTLPSPQSDLAQQMLKDPYIFDFINISEKANERDIEEQLCQHVTKFYWGSGKVLHLSEDNIKWKLAEMIFLLTCFFIIYG